MSSVLLRFMCKTRALPRDGWYNRRPDNRQRTRVAESYKCLAAQVPSGSYAIFHVYVVYVATATAR